MSAVKLRDAFRCPGAAATPGSLRTTAQPTPRGLRYLLVIIGLYLLFPVLDLPFTDISLSAPLMGLLLFEITRNEVRWLARVDRPLLRRAAWLICVLLLSWSVNLLLQDQSFTASDLLLGLRLPYWVAAMVAVSLVVGRSPDPSLYQRALGYGVMVLGVVRLLSAEFAGMWRVDRALGLTQNMYGLLFATFWPFALVMATAKRSRAALAKFGAATLLVAIVVNGSRGSWLAVTLTTGLYLLVLLVLPGARLRRTLAIAALVFLVVAAASALKVILEENIAQLYLNRLETFRELEQDTSYQTRIAMRKKALALFRQSPLFGVGPGRFTRTMTEFEVPERLSGRSLEDLNRRNSHSAYFQFLAETGVLGSLPFMALLAWLVLKGARTALRLSVSGLAWPLGYYLGFVGMSVHLVVIAGLLGTLPWFVYGLVGGMVTWERRWRRVLPDLPRARRLARLR